MQKKVYIGVGSNLGESIKIIEAAYRLLEQQVGKIEKRSSFYETPPWGFEATNNFINAVVQISTNKKPFDIMSQLLQIEEQLGRSRDKMAKGYSSRKIDLDILAIDDEIIKEKSLIVPHPKLHLRAFVLIPLKEIEPAWHHPVESQSIDALLSKIDKEELKKPILIEN